VVGQNAKQSIMHDKTRLFTSADKDLEIAPALASIEHHYLFDDCQNERYAMQKMSTFDNKLCVDIVTAVWNKSANLQIGDPLRNSPLYIPEDVEGIVLDTMQLANIALRKTELPSCGNRIITGVKGVGKTTTMKGSAVVMATLYPNILVVMLNFQEQTQEATLLEHIISLARLKRNEIEKDETIARLAYLNLEGLLTHLRVEYDLYVAFFGEEIQTLFQREAVISDNTVKTVKNLITIGKSKHAFAILSGTSSHTQELAFQAAKRPEYDSYPSLNDTVYRISRMSPFREKSKLKAMLSIVFPAMLFEDSDIDSIFSATGGVGRNINEIQGHTRIRETR
jgi:hypothetical protein